MKNSLFEMVDLQIFVLYLRLRVVNSNVHRLIFGLLKKAPALLVGAFLIYNHYKLLTNNNKTNNY